MAKKKVKIPKDDFIRALTLPLALQHPAAMFFAGHWKMEDNHKVELSLVEIVEIIHRIEGLEWELKKTKDHVNHLLIHSGRVEMEPARPLKNQYYG